MVKSAIRPRSRKTDHLIRDRQRSLCHYLQNRNIVFSRGFTDALDCASVQLARRTQLEVAYRIEFIRKVSRDGRSNLYSLGLEIEMDGGGIEGWRKVTILS
jgi:hypothetical protein